MQADMQPDRFAFSAEAASLYESDPHILSRLANGDQR